MSLRFLSGPPAISDPKVDRTEFEGARGVELSGHRRSVSTGGSGPPLHFFVAGSVISTPVVDGVHLDADQHQTLGIALAGVVLRALNG